MTPRYPDIAVLGTGRMGAPIARNLLAASFAVAVWNRTPARAQALAGAGARVAASPADAATSREGAVSALRPGSVWIQMATVGVDWTERFCALAHDHGLEFVDAPVSGSDGPARDGQLVVLASGTDAVHARVQPVFDAIARRTLWLGPAGNGTRLKLVLNTWLASLAEAMAETLALTGALGLDQGLFLDAIAGGPLDAPWATGKARAMLAREFRPGFALRLALKDAHLALRASHEHDLELPLTDALARRWERAITRHGDDDIAAVIDAVTAPQPAGRSEDHRRS